LDVYEPHDPARLWDAGILHTLAFIGACLPLIIGAALAIRDKDGLWVNKNAERIAFLGLLAASAVGAKAGARFYPHYYIQLIPPLALLAAPPYAPAWFGKTRLRSWFLRPAVISAWLAITVVAFFISHWKLLALDREPSETARYLTAHSAPNDRIFVWGRSAAEVYLQARRRPACRYILTFPLTGFVFGGELPGVDTRNRIVAGATFRFSPGCWSNITSRWREPRRVWFIECATLTGFEPEKSTSRSRVISAQAFVVMYHRGQIA
jgi:hypothetical protein